MWSYEKFLSELDDDAAEQVRKATEELTDDDIERTVSSLRRVHLGSVIPLSDGVPNDIMHQAIEHAIANVRSLKSHNKGGGKVDTDTPFPKSGLLNVYRSEIASLTAKELRTKYGDDMPSDVRMEDGGIFLYSLGVALSRGYVPIAVGWVKDALPSDNDQRPAVSDEIIDKISTLNSWMGDDETSWPFYSQHRTLMTKGFHACEVRDGGCSAEESATTYDLGRTLFSDGTQAPIGHGATFFVADLDQPDVVYAAPEMVSHYMRHHGYRPPVAFVRAVEAIDLGALDRCERDTLEDDHEASKDEGNPWY